MIISLFQGVLKLFMKPQSYTGKGCPPCNHDCNQGRNCPARKRVQ